MKRGGWASDYNINFNKFEQLVKKDSYEELVLTLIETRKETIEWLHFLLMELKYELSTLIKSCPWMNTLVWNEEDFSFQKKGGRFNFISKAFNSLTLRSKLPTRSSVTFRALRKKEYTLRNSTEDYLLVRKGKKFEKQEFALTKSSIQVKTGMVKKEK